MAVWIDSRWAVDHLPPNTHTHPSPTITNTPRPAPRRAAFLYWAYSQPTEFDSLVAAQRQFMHDLYEGNLLSDVAQVREAGQGSFVLVVFGCGGLWMEACGGLWWE